MRISTLFRCRKNSSRLQFQSTDAVPKEKDGEHNHTDPTSSSRRRRRKEPSAWCVYLIISSTMRKTYVGVTTNFPRRLKQHNGELKGGAKASRAGRPWIHACIVRGFRDRSEACEFEAKWKNITRKLPRKREKQNDGSPKHCSNTVRKP